MQFGSLLGLKIGGFQLVEELGRGTASVTFLARDEQGKSAIVKRLLDSWAEQPAAVAKFLSAVDLSAKRRMKRFVAVVTSQKSSTDGVFLLREYIEGWPLSDFLRRSAAG